MTCDRSLVFSGCSDFIHQQNLQGSCCLRCIFLLLEISKMIALFHLAIVLSVVLFTALVSTNVFWVNVALIIRRYCVQAIVMIKLWTTSDLGIVINSLERWLHIVHPLGFNGVRVTRSLVLCVMLCRSLCVPLSFFFWPLHCLSFYLRILITTLASSNSCLWTHNPCIGKMVSFQLFNDAYNY